MSYMVIHLYINNNIPDKGCGICGVLKNRVLTPGSVVGRWNPTEITCCGKSQNPVTLISMGKGKLNSWRLTTKPPQMLVIRNSLQRSYENIGSLENLESGSLALVSEMLESTKTRLSVYDPIRGDNDSTDTKIQLVLRDFPNPRR